MARTYIPAIYVIKISQSQFESYENENGLSSNMSYKDWFCNCCQIQFTNKLNFRNHKETVHVKGYDCKFCPKSYTKVYGYERHFKSKHAIEHSTTNNEFNEMRQNESSEKFTTAELWKNSDSSTSSSQINGYILDNNASQDCFYNHNSSSCEIPKFQDISALSNRDIVESSNGLKSTDGSCEASNYSKIFDWPTIVITNPFDDKPYLQSALNQNVPAISNRKRKYPGYPCVNCYLSFDFKRDLDNHCAVFHKMKLVKERKSPRVGHIYYCPKCNYSAKTVVTIVKHCQKLHKCDYKSDEIKRTEIKTEPDSTSASPRSSTPQWTINTNVNYPQKETVPDSTSASPRSSTPQWNYNINPNYPHKNGQVKPKIENTPIDNHSSNYIPGKPNKNTVSPNLISYPNKALGNLSNASILPPPTFKSTVSSLAKFQQSQISDSDSSKFKNLNFKVPELKFKTERNMSVSRVNLAHELVIPKTNHKQNLLTPYTQQILDSFPPTPPTPDLNSAAKFNFKMDQTYPTVSDSINRMPLPEIDHFLDRFPTPDLTTSCKFNFTMNQTSSEALKCSSQLTNSDPPSKYKIQHANFQVLDWFSSNQTNSETRECPTQLAKGITPSDFKIQPTNSQVLEKFPSNKTNSEAWESPLSQLTNGITTSEFIIQRINSQVVEKSLSNQTNCETWKYPSSLTNGIAPSKFKIQHNNFQVLDKFQLNQPYSEAWECPSQLTNSIAPSKVNFEWIRQFYFTTNERDSKVSESYPLCYISRFSSKVTMNEIDSEILDLFSDPALPFAPKFQGYYRFIETEDLTYDKSAFPYIVNQSDHKNIHIEHSDLSKNFYVLIDT